MKINVIATGSAGNLYEVVDVAGNSMLIEAGYSIEMYMKHRVGVIPPECLIVSHKHTDHYSFALNWSAFTDVHVEPEKVETKSWKVMGFDVEHGGCPCKAFIIKSLVENRMFLFATDLMYDDAKIKDLEQICSYLELENFVIECNYNDYLYHLAKAEQRIGCDRHFSDNDVVRFVRNTEAKKAKIITIHGSHRLCSDSYTKRYLGGKLPAATIAVAVGATKSSKNVFII